jgi:protein-S-isoprenylcysteine O-methyltransferase Ste14
MLETVLIWIQRGAWLLWLVYWIVAARRAKTTRAHEAGGARALDAVLLLTAAFLMGARGVLPEPLTARFIPADVTVFALATVLTVAGLLFSVWARAHLGSNWSSTVTLKAEHALIRSGPYRFVRHPIYSGVLLALLGTVIALGEWRGVIALVLLFGAFFRRTRAEETQLRTIFPDYEQYAGTTAALIPYIY